MCRMSNSSKAFWTAAELAPRWHVHRATVARIMARFGCAGIKFGDAQQAARRFSAAEVELV
jgi:DNA-binding MurR/RpiR family transcriptional regulator